MGIYDMTLWRNVENDPKLSYMSSVVRKPAFCICESKGSAADWCLCFRYIDSTIYLLSKSEMLSSVSVTYKNELRHEKTNTLHMRKQRHRSASR